MTGGQKDLINYRISRAKETLNEANLMFNNGHLYGAANRVYYACFYAAVALLLTKNMSSSKHSGIASLFNLHFVKAGTVSVDMGKFYARIFDNRLECDYGELVELSKEQLQQDLITAEEFINKIISLCSSARSPADL
jgi:uncharacterized protein (UPF0332 family)